MSGSDSVVAIEPSKFSGSPVIDTQLLEVLRSAGAGLFSCKRCEQIQWKKLALITDHMEPVAIRPGTNTPSKLKNKRDCCEAEESEFIAHLSKFFKCNLSYLILRK